MTRLAAVSRVDPRNPLVSLPGVCELAKALGPGERRALSIVLTALQRDANAKAEEAWRYLGPDGVGFEFRKLDRCKDAVACRARCEAAGGDWPLVDRWGRPA